ncbi:hypothetical protein [Donghicola mangrovi]|uniref:Uncharacterized protein n=1 Tax=Donghicola mangrovi TaxID=2729614 RepID=A0A850QH84_9RHOB|nr:hypothetical protein [Donghicola mangrovi]NVO25181.1 hypothetical protein [Donghicola mangrovi]
MHRFRVGFFVVLLAFGLVGTSYGHHFATAKEESLLTFYAALGATTDLCGDDLESSKSSCNACRLVSAFLMPDPVGHLVPVELAYVQRIVLPDLARAAGLTVLGHPPSRAPPVA